MRAKEVLTDMGSSLSSSLVHLKRVSEFFRVKTRIAPDQFLVLLMEISLDRTSKMSEYISEYLPKQRNWQRKSSFKMDYRI